MRLVCISDTHNGHAQVDLPAGDILVHTGDFSAHGRLDEIRRFLDWFATVGPFRHRLLVAGNHDFAFERTPALARALLPEGVTYLQGDGVELDGLRFWGSPLTPAFGGWAFGGPEDELDREWSRIPDDVDVLLTHGPPWGVLDHLATTGRSVGCRALARTVARLAPRLHVFGHIHEGYGRVQQGRTLFVNAAICDVNYQPGQRPQVIDLATEPPG